MLRDRRDLRVLRMRSRRGELGDRPGSETVTSLCGNEEVREMVRSGGIWPAHWRVVWLLLRCAVATLALVLTVGTGSAAASSTVTFDGSPGTAAPPATLGPYQMTPFGTDPQPSGQTVTGVTAPAGEITFSGALEHLTVGAGWATWSHGYPGDVYATYSSATPDSVTVTMPPNTIAFYLYTEPNPFAVIDITATTDHGTTSGAIPVNGHAGAQYFGFYTDGSTSIQTITVSSSTDFAIGEFGINTSGRYAPNPDGYSFANFADTNPSTTPYAPYDGMAADYPGSRSEMYFFGTGIHTIEGTTFFDNVFLPNMAGALCYGFAATSTYLFNEAPFGSLDIFDLLPSATSPLPFTFDGRGGVPAQAFIERYHSRQYAQVGAYTALAAYGVAAGKGNLGVFNHIARIVAGRPVTVALVPSASLLSANPGRWWQLYNLAHVVVAYNTATGGGNDIVDVYNPNSPNDATATLTIDSQGGLQSYDAAEGVRYGGGTVNGTDYGQPSEWQMVVLPDFAWLDNSSETAVVGGSLFGLGGGVSQTIDNQHWILDFSGQTQFFFSLGATPQTSPNAPVLTMDGGARNAAQELIPSGQPFSSQIATAQTPAVSGVFSGNHVATVTETDPASVRRQHTLTVDPSAMEVTLSNASSQQQYNVTLGADYLPNYGRQFTITGVSLAPSQVLQAGTDASSDGVTLSSTGPTQMVSVNLAQVGQDGATTTVQAAVPGTGVLGKLSIFDWSDVQQSLIYETFRANGGIKVQILQQNTSQLHTLDLQIFDQLRSTIEELGDQGIRQSLNAKLDAARARFDGGNPRAAANILGALENETQAQAGKTIPATMARAIQSTAELLVGFLQT
jgi:hypothetical protein